MDIKSILNKTKEKKDAFWSIIIEPESVAAAIWEVEESEVKIISQESVVPLSQGQDTVSAVDDVLSSVIVSLPDDYIEPEKTVFGLPSSWIDGGNIKDEYLTELKKICDELSLKPSGFVVLSEAMAHYIKSEEGSPLSGITVGVSEKNLEISLFRLGKLSGTFEVARSVSISEDLVEGLTRFGNAEVFPSRIIIYDGKSADLDDLRSELTNTDWENIEKIKFLHTPKVDVFDLKVKITAVCLAGGAELANATKIVRVTKVAESEGENNEVVNVVEPETPLSASDLGFVVDDVTESPAPQLQNQPVVKNGDKNKLNFKLPKIPKFNFRVSKPKIKMNKNISNNNFKKPLIIGGVSLVTFLVAGFLFWWFYPKASVLVYVSPKKLNEEMTVTLGSDVSANTLTVNVSGDKTKPTTGTKIVGETAKGAVTIQNGTASNINLDSGTKIISSSGLEFVLQNEASVSAALSPSSPGTTTVDIEASSIGSEYNLVKDEIFKVSNYPQADVDATSNDDFSGGSSREISAVSEDDLVSLEKSLTNELLDQAKEELTSQVSTDQILVDSSLTSEATSTDFSNKEGDEASTLKLSLSLEVAVKSVSKKDLIASSNKILEGKVPTGFVLRDDQINYVFEVDKENNEKFKVLVSVNLLPVIDIDQVAEAVAGKTPEIARDHISSIPGFVRAEFRVAPLFPGKLGTLPHVVGRINVEISAEK